MIISNQEKDGIQTWVEAFILERTIRGLSENTLDYYQRTLEAFTNWCNKHQTSGVLELTANHLRQYLYWLIETGHNPGGCHAHYRAIRAFLNFFEDEVEPDNWKNPINKVSAPKVQKAPLDPVSIPDALKLVSVCDPTTFHGARDKAIFLTLLETGVRASELLQIDLGDLDLIHGSIQIKHGKGGKVRVVLIGKKVRKAIRKWLRVRPQNHGRLFTKKNGARLCYSGLRGVLNRRSKEANISGVTLHDFRRAFCLNQLQAGTPEITIARLMGHSNTQLIGLYAKQTTREIRQVFHSVADSEF